MRNVVSVGLVLVAAVTVLWLTAVRAQAHFLGFDSVDGCEIRWEESTQYDTERVAAQNAWEALKGSDNCVNIEPDVWWTITDLEWFDANRSDVTWAGLYEYEAGADDIHLNIYYMAGYSDCQRKFVTMHELGHAHGLDHSFSPNIMYGVVQSYCTLGSHDQTDYAALWGAI